jgi:hypothetical protein
MRRNRLFRHALSLPSTCCFVALSVGQDWPCLRASDGQEVYRERMPTRRRVYAAIVSEGGEKLLLTTRLNF